MLVALNYINALCYMQYKFFQFKYMQFLETAFSDEVHKIFWLFCDSSVGNAVTCNGAVYAKDRNVPLW